MDHIIQLKKIRADAIARLRNSPDFKLAGKLGQLIVELGDTIEDKVVFDDPAIATELKDVKATIAQSPRPLTTAFPPKGLKSEPSTADTEKTELKAGEEMIEELVAEIENDAAELDAVASKSDEKADASSISSFFKSSVKEDRHTNGAAH